MTLNGHNTHRTTSQYRSPDYFTFGVANVMRQYFSFPLHFPSRRNEKTWYHA
jgi:hypothetical protein